MIDIFPTIGSTENVSDIFELHVFALVVATVENHLVGTCSAFEAVFANVHAVFGRGVEGGDLRDDEHVAAGGAEEEHCLIDLKFLFFGGGIFLLWLVSEGDLDEVVVFVLVVVVVVRRLRVVTSESFLGFPGSAFKSVWSELEAVVMSGMSREASRIQVWDDQDIHMKILIDEVKRSRYSSVELILAGGSRDSRGHLKRNSSAHHTSILKQTWIGLEVRGFTQHRIF